MARVDTGYSAITSLDGDEKFYAVDDPSGTPTDGNVTPTVIRDFVRIQVGTGSPESVVTADVGTLYLRTDGGASTTLYVKESGAGNTGWVAK